MTNMIASKLLGYSSEEMVSLHFKDIIIKEKGQVALPDMLFNDKGEMVVFNGKVVRVIKTLPFYSISDLFLFCLIGGIGV